MARGFLSGALWGGVLSLGVGGVASVMAPPPLQPGAPAINDIAPDRGQVEVETEEAKTDVAGTPSEAAPQDAVIASQTPAPDVDALPDVENQPSSAPDVAATGLVASLDTPSEGPTAGSVALAEVDPVLPNPQALAPMIPQEADAVVIDTAPAAPRQPRAQEPEPESLPAAAGNTGILGEGVESDSERADAIVDQPAVQDQQEAAVEPPLGVADQTEPEPETAEAAPEQTVPEEAVEEDAAQVAVLAPSARPRIGTPAISLTDRNIGVTINRPGNATPEEEPQQVTTISEAGTTGQSGALAPLKRYAQPFANPDNKPLMGIVLIDNGTSPTSGAAGIAALRSFPYALSFAVDSSLPDAAERMALYRDEGFEVMAVIDLPSGARPTDVETTFGVTLSQMREVVGVLEGTGEGLQGARAVSDQVTAILAQTGHGLVTQAKGLNTMSKLARKEGVPADPVFRDFDSKGQTATVIRRFLDQAAFKAGQEGAVIMLGRLRPDTISALLLWGLQDRAGQVALAPISAVLSREDG